MHGNRAALLLGVPGTGGCAVNGELLVALVVIVGIVFVGIMANHWSNVREREQAEAESRRRVQAEFRAIVQKRPHHIAGISRHMMGLDDQGSDHAVR